jgi:hypothetical protein
LLAGVDTKKYGRLKTKLNNAYYVAGQKNYPKTVESALAMLSHYMNNKGVCITDEDKEGQMHQESFMKKHKNVTYYKCGKKGHYANKCPSGDSNDNVLSTISNLLNNPSSHSRPNCIAWSGQYDVGLTLLEARSMIPHECDGQT